MGYAHRFTQHRDFNDAEWNNIQQSLKIAVRNLPATSTSAGGDYQGYEIGICTYDPKTQRFDKKVNACADMVHDKKDGDSHITFDGDADAGLDESTMLLCKRMSDPHSFCKTNGKPYDWLVVALLAIVQVHAPDVLTIRSDGDTDDIQPVINWLNAIIPEYNFKNFATI